MPRLRPRIVRLTHWLNHDRAELKTRTAAARALGRPNAAFEIAQCAWEAAVRSPQPSRLTDLESNRLVAWLRRHNLSNDD